MAGDAPGCPRTLSGMPRGLLVLWGASVASRGLQRVHRGIPGGVIPVRFAKHRPWEGIQGPLQVLGHVQAVLFRYIQHHYQGASVVMRHRGFPRHESWWGGTLHRPLPTSSATGHGNTPCSRHGPPPGQRPPGCPGQRCPGPRPGPSHGGGPASIRSPGTPGGHHPHRGQEQATHHQQHQPQAAHPWVVIPVPHHPPLLLAPPQWPVLPSWPAVPFRRSVLP